MTDSDEYRAALDWMATLQRGDIVKRADGLDWEVLRFYGSNGVGVRRAQQVGRVPFRRLYNDELIKAFRATKGG